MIHPRHGATHVYDDDQKASHEKNGWKVQTEEEMRAELVTQAPTIEAALAEIPRRGRPRKAA